MNALRCFLKGTPKMKEIIKLNRKIRHNKYRLPIQNNVKLYKKKNISTKKQIIYDQFPLV